MAGSLAIVALLLTLVPIDAVWAAMRAVSPWVWALTVAIFIAGHGINALKLWLLVGPDRAPVTLCLHAHFTGIAANLGLPGVAGGDIVRVSYLAPTAGIARVAMAAVAERLVDLSVLALMAVAAVWAAGLPTALADAGGVGGRVMVFALVIGIPAGILVFRRIRRAGGAGGLTDAWWGVLARPRALGLAAALSLAVQTAFVLTNVWLGAQAGVALGVAPWFLAWPVSKLSVVLPISLGGIGVREAALVSVLAAYGASADRVLAAAILWQAALIAGSLLGFLLSAWLRPAALNRLPPTSRPPSGR